MASLTKTYSQEKLYGQVYTPDYIVSKILDDVGYNSPNILGRKIVDPACGDGRFLVEIVKRILQFSPKDKLMQNLACVHGWDIDEVAIKQCILNLNKIVKDVEIEWNIYVTDSIKKYEQPYLLSENSVEKFDFIVGNPPYIRIQHLDVEQREYIQKHYNFCKSGSTDIYIAFYELCIYLLTINGICGLITPNSFLFNETARTLRQYFTASKNLLQITNYGDIQLFNEVTTYSAITIFNAKQQNNFLFQKALSEKTFEERQIDFSELQEPFWQLSTSVKKVVKGKKLKEICDIHVGITTLCDSAYIFQIEPIDDAYVYANTKFCGRVKIEKHILKPIIKASKLKKSTENIKEYVLFPYKNINGKHQILPEEELKALYPLAYRYLLSVKRELDLRDNGRANPAGWYAFGRSQGLDTSFGEKILFSPMNQRPNFVLSLNANATFYSGYCIKKIIGCSIENLLLQLNSDRMEQFVSMSSRDFRSGWKAYNKKVIENFEIIV